MHLVLIGSPDSATAWKRSESILQLKMEFISKLNLFDVYVAFMSTGATGKQVGILVV